MQTAVKKIAHLLSRAGIEDLFGEAEAAAGSADRDKAKKLDVVAVRTQHPPVHAGPCKYSCRQSM